MAKMSTRQAVAKAFAPHSKEYQRRAAMADAAKKRSQKQPQDIKRYISDNENSARNDVGKFMTALRKTRNK
jgi:rubrerythrin